MGNLMLEKYTRTLVDSTITLSPIMFDYFDPTKNTVALPANYILDIKRGHESLKFPVKLGNIPVKLEQGYKLNGTYYRVMNKFQRAPGVFVIEKKELGVLRHRVEYIPANGMKVSFMENKGMIVAIFKGDKLSKGIPVSIFLKALTGKSFSELTQLLGIRNQIIPKSFMPIDDKEPSTEDCIKVVLTHINKLKDGVELSPFYLRKTMDIVFRRDDVNQIELSRFKESIKFSKRLGKEYYTLAQKIEINKIEDDGTTSTKVFKKGEVITTELLNTIDNSNITSLVVRDKNKTVAELVKLNLEESPTSDNGYLNMVNLLVTTQTLDLEIDSYYDSKNKRLFTEDDLFNDLIGKNANKLLDFIADQLIVGKDSLTDIELPKLDEYLDYDIIERSLKDSSSDDSASSQGAENTNIVSEISNGQKMISDLKGIMTADMAAVQDSNRGSQDPYHTPESKDAGITGYSTLDSKLDNGVLLTPYARYNNCVCQNPNEPIYLQTADLFEEYCAAWDAKVEEDKYVDAYYQGRVVRVKSELVTYQEWSDYSNTSLATSLISFKNHAQGKRLVMGSGQSKQADPCIHVEPPYVSTGSIGMYQVGTKKCKDVLLAYYLKNPKVRDTLNIEEEDFINNSTIKLIGMKPVKDYKDYTFKIKHSSGFEDITIESQPYSLRSSENTLIRTCINKELGLNHTYKPNEIVMHRRDIFVGKRNLELNLATGHKKIEDKSVFDSDIATGNNFHVAFMPYSSSTMDDSLIIRKGLIGSYKLTTVNLVTKKYELSRNADYREEFTGVGSDNFEDNGLPKKGTYIKPRGIWLGLRRVPVSDTSEIKTANKCLDAVTEGIVISASIERNMAIVTLATIREPQIADKMAGSHGNKGVIANIVDDKDMPFNAETGQVYDICLNPLGIPSRMNIAQILEAGCGLAMYLKEQATGEKCAVVVSPGNPDGLKITQELMDEWACNPVQLVDGRTCIPFARKTNTGVLYMKKLTHTSSSKFNSCGIPNSYNPGTLQVRKGKKVEGGQKLGEMEKWALVANNCKAILRDVTTTYSNDIKARENMNEYMKEIGRNFAKRECINNDFSNDSIQDDINRVRLNHGENRNDRHLNCFTMSMGLIMDEKNGFTNPRRLTKEDIRALSAKPIEPNPEFLHGNVFGIPKGVNTSRLDKWSYILTGCEFVHPIYFYKTNLAHLLVARVWDNSVEAYVTDTLTPRKLQDLVSGDMYINIDEGSIIYREKPEGNPLGIWKTGMDAVCYMLRNCNIDKAVELINKQLESKYKNSLKYQEEIIKLESYKRMAEDFKSTGGFEQIIWDCFPIMPEHMRLSDPQRTPDFDIYYSSIMTAAKKGDADEVYLRVLDFTGLDNSRIVINKGNDAKTLMEFFAGKNSNDRHGFIRDKAMSHIVMLSGRAVIVSAEAGTVPIGTVGLPFAGAVNNMRVAIEEILSFYDELQDVNLETFLNLLVNGDINALGDLLDVPNVESFCNEVRNKIIQFLEEQIVIAGRQPTLHKYSIRGFKVKIFFDFACHLNQLNCDAYNADFDGDQFWWVFMISEDAKREAIERMSPLSEIIHQKDGSMVLEPNQDTLLGLYLDTMLYKNKDHLDEEYYTNDKFRIYTSIDTLKFDKDNGRLSSWDPVVYRDKRGYKYISTAGRILFNSFLPNGFTSEQFTNRLGFKVNPKLYKELRYDGLIKKKGKGPKGTPNEEGLYPKEFVEYGLGKISQEMFEEFGTEGTAKFFDKCLTIYTDYCHRTGITLDLKDFIEHPKTDELMEKAQYYATQFSEQCELGLITEQARKEACESIYKYISNYVQDTLLDYYYKDRNNNLFIILDSGARGNLNQLRQTCGIIGIVHKNDKENHESPVLGNFFRGLSSSASRIASYDTIMGVFAAQNETADAGELSRTMAYTMGNLDIIEHDCGEDDVRLPVKYKSEGFKIDSELLGEILDKTSDIYRFSENLLGANGEINSVTIDYFIRKQFRKIPLENGKVVTISYQLDDYFKSLILNRTAKDLPYLREDKYVTPDTIKFIEDENLEFVNIRTLFTCQSVGGVCSRCYGLNFDKFKLEKPRMNISMQAAESLGQPGTQLTLNKINQNADVDCLSIFRSYMDGSTPKNIDKRIIAEKSGFVRVKDFGKDDVVIELFEKYKVPKDDCIVQDGEYVDINDMLTKGAPVIRDINGEDIEEVLIERSMLLTKTLFDLYYNSQIEELARNFEIAARIQASVVKVYESHDPDIKVGDLLFYQDVKDNDKIRYQFGTCKRRDSILRHGGIETSLSSQDFGKIIGDALTNPARRISVPDSALGGILSGTIEGKVKPLKIQRFKNMINKENKNEITSDKADISDMITVITEQSNDINTGIFDFVEDTNSQGSVVVNNVDNTEVSFENIFDELNMAEVTADVENNNESLFDNLSFDDIEITEVDFTDENDDKKDIETATW